MPTIMMTVAKPVRAGASRSKPRLVLHGRRRKSVVKLKEMLDVVLRQDAAEIARAARLNYSPSTVSVRPTHANYAAMVRVQSRCAEILAERG